MFAIDIHTRLLAQIFHPRHFFSFEKDRKHWQKACHPSDKDLIFLKHHMKYIQSAPLDKSLNRKSNVVKILSFTHVFSPANNLLHSRNSFPISHPMFNIYHPHSPTSTQLNHQAMQTNVNGVSHLKTPDAVLPSLLRQKITSSVSKVPKFISTFPTSSTLY